MLILGGLGQLYRLSRLKVIEIASCPHYDYHEYQPNIFSQYCKRLSDIYQEEGYGNYQEYTPKGNVESLDPWGNSSRLTSLFGHKCHQLYKQSLKDNDRYNKLEYRLLKSHQGLNP